MACDASGYGIGAILVHRGSNGKEQPIGFVSLTLTAAEKNYSQIEKEALACVFGITKFHTYLYGHKLILPLSQTINPFIHGTQGDSPAGIRENTEMGIDTYSI